MLNGNRPRGEKSRPHPWLAAFFAFGASMCALTIALLLFPGTALDTVWRLNPDAHGAFETIGGWSVAIMLIVGAACCSAAIGLWRGACWGTQVALILLTVNMLGDLINTVFRHDYRSLVGLPVGAAMIFYLVRK